MLFGSRNGNRIGLTSKVAGSTSIASRWSHITTNSPCFEVKVRHAPSRVAGRCPRALVTLRVTSQRRNNRSCCCCSTLTNGHSSCGTRIVTVSVACVPTSGVGTRLACPVSSQIYFTASGPGREHVTVQSSGGIARWGYVLFLSRAKRTGLTGSSPLPKSTLPCYF